MTNYTYNEGDEVLNQFRLKKPLGKGGFGEVWLAQDRLLNQEFALKIIALESLFPDIDSFLKEAEKNRDIARILKEARRGHHIIHKNLVKCHSANMDNQAFFIKMDYLENGSVTKTLNSEGFLPIKQVLTIMIDILRGLEHLHTNDILHNDIKPDNIMIGNDNNYLLSDLGISLNKLAPEPSSVYMPHLAPELFKSPSFSKASDIYQCGCTLFRLLNGVHLIKNQCSENEQFIEKVSKGKLIKEIHYQLFIPPSLRTVIKKATHSDPVQRYKSATDFRNALEKLTIFADWDFNSEGLLVGECCYNIYSFEENPKSDGTSEFIAFKTSKKSKIRQKMSKFCGNNLSKKDLNKKKAYFLQSVVKGKIK
ncbi:MAG: serine/threonine-protein kinase [Vampirovibrionales bacterium]